NHDKDTETQRKATSKALLAAFLCVSVSLSWITYVYGAAAPALRWWTHVEALANDGMEGRNTGSPAHKRAAEYVAGEFKKSGLEPAGVGGYIQPVKFKTRRIVEAQSTLALVRHGKA